MNMPQGCRKISPSPNWLEGTQVKIKKELVGNIKKRQQIGKKWC